MNKSIEQLCPIMAKLVKKYGASPIPSEKNYSAYEALFRAIVYQQLSSKAASTILGRVLKLFDLEILGDIVPFPSPQAVLEMNEDAMRSAGLSWNKIKAIKDLSLKKIEGIVPDNEEVKRLSDDEIINRLIMIRGIGRWSVEMYLIFTLGREDVWPIDDLGVRKGYQHAYNIDEMPSPKQLFELGQHLKPFRSHAAWYLWRVCDELKPKKPPKGAPIAKGEGK